MCSSKPKPATKNILFDNNAVKDATYCDHWCNVVGVCLCTLILVFPYFSCCRQKHRGLHFKRSISMNYATEYTKKCDREESLICFDLDLNVTMVLREWSFCQAFQNGYGFSSLSFLLQRPVAGRIQIYCSSHVPVNFAGREQCYMVVLTIALARS